MAPRAELWAQQAKSGISAICHPILVQKKQKNKKHEPHVPQVLEALVWTQFKNNT